MSTNAITQRNVRIRKESVSSVRCFQREQETVFWCLTDPLNAWRVEMEQWALGWGQSPTESCPKDRKEMGNREP